jgi:ATP-dependent helicase/DNAse subunit B
VCRFDRTVPGNEYRHLSQKEAEEIWLKIRKCGEEAEENE